MAAGRVLAAYFAELIHIATWSPYSLLSVISFKFTKVTKHVFFSISLQPVIVDPKSFHLKDDRKKSCSPTPTPPSTPRKVKGKTSFQKLYFDSNLNIHFDCIWIYILLINLIAVNTLGAMTVSVTHAQVSIASATTSATTTAVVAITMARPPSPANSSGSDTDAAVNSTALRRLYFKSTRSAKSKGPTVPKVLHVFKQILFCYVYSLLLLTN